MRRNPSVGNNDDRPRIPEVLERATCTRHGADTDQPCWWIWTLRGRKAPAICNDRAKRAGFDAPIQPSSLGIDDSAEAA